MKKSLSIALAMLMLLGLCACSKTEPKKEAAAFQVGYGRVDFTPSVSVPLGGFGDDVHRLSEGALDGAEEIAAFEKMVNSL